MKIGYRLGIGFGLMLGVMAIITAIGTILPAHTKNNLNKTIHITDIKFSLVSEMRARLLAEQIAGRRIGILTEYDDIQKNMDIIFAQQQKYASAKQQLLNMKLEPAEILILKDIDKYEKICLPYIKEAQEDIQKFNPGRAAKVLSTKATPIQDQWMQRMDNLIEFHHRKIQEDLKDFDATSFEANVGMISAGTTSIFLAAIVAWMLTQSITIPLGHAVELTKKVAEGDLTIQPEIITQDETGHLLSAFGHMVIRLKEARDEIAHSHRLIMESIHYASTIQRSYLRASDEYMTQNLKDYFIHWSPKDIVGGDFYFFRSFPGVGHLLAIMDCTGHGVPGACMTMIMASLLEQATHRNNISNPAQLLSIMNKTVKRVLNQFDMDIEQLLDQKETRSDDGMDAAFLFFSEDFSHLTFAGANIPIFILSPTSTDIEIIKDTIRGVGHISTPFDYEWKNHSITLTENTLLFIATDGLTDQIGGAKRIQYGRNAIKKIMQTHRHSLIQDLKEAIVADFERYQGNEKRRDDITFFCIRLSK